MDISSRNNFIAYTGEEQSNSITRHRVVKKKSGVRRDTLTGEIILPKGDGCEDVISIEDLRNKLANLKANANVKIRKLSGQLKEDFDSLAQYVAWIYNTESYPLLYAEIQNYFSPDDTYYPGTIGAYCGGCLVKRKDGLLTRGCTVICAGSIPPPYEDPDWDFCSDLVIWAVYNGEAFEFTTLNEVDNEKDDKAIIFIEYNSLDSFPGFSEEEKKTLREHGINQVRLVYYNPEGNPMYKEVSGGFVSLDSIKTRQPKPIPPIVTQSWGWWSVFFAAFFLILLFVILCRYSRRA